MRDILFVAGEVSGELHASGVARELKASNAPFRLIGVGGDRMRAAGVELIEHVSNLSVMGFVEPLKRLPRYLALRRQLAERIQSGTVALVVLVDSAGFNMTIAEIATAAKVPVLYYITPQVWASRAGRLAALSRTVTRAAVILPFEAALLREHGIDATFVGHPLLDRARELPDRDDARRLIGADVERPLLALFPGSRRQEMRHHLEPFVAAARELQRRIPGLQVIVSKAPHVSIRPSECPFPLVSSASFTILRASDAAICKSGTTTLEAAVALCPLIVAYRTDAVTYALAKRVVKIPNIGLVNVLAGREVAREFVQGEVEPMAMADAIAPLLRTGSPERERILRDLAEVRAMLGEVGAARRVADMALELAQRAA